jgi:hypothetical protein
MSRIISMLAKLSFLVATAAVFTLAPAPAAAASSGPDDCLQPPITCPPYSDLDCRDACLRLYPDNGDLHTCYGRCICAC